jgi:hypothetical protein
MALPQGTLNSSRAPYPADCQTDIFNTGCAQAMGDLCAGGATSNETNQYRSDLLNPETNCYFWKIQYENAFYFANEAMSSLIKPLDLAKIQYCSSNFGATSPECSCMSFPNLYADQCNAQQTAQRGCPANNTNPGAPIGTNLCSGKDFTKTNSGNSMVVDGQIVNGSYVGFSFASCVPYFCWLEPCLSTGTQLLTSDIILATTFQGACSTGVCMSVVGSNDFSTNQTFSDLQPPMGANVMPAFELFAPCGKDTGYAKPNYLTTTYTLPVDNVTQIPVAISNNGSIAARLNLQGSNVNWISMPKVLSIAGISASRYFATVNPALLTLVYNQQSANGVYPNVFTSNQYKPGQTIPPGVMPAPIFTYTYNDGLQSAPQTFTLELDFVFTPPINKVQQSTSQPSVPIGVYIFVGVAALLFLFALIMSARTDAQILDLQDQATQQVIVTGTLAQQVNAITAPKGPSVV